MRTDAADQKRKLRVVLILGVAQTFAWASTYYLPAVLGGSMAAELGLERSDLFGLFSLALIVAAASGPLTGRLIDRFGGKPVLVGSSLLFALCLVLLASATSVWQLTLAWLGMGVGLASGLYEAAFATVVRLYGQSARSAITGITLLGGFASTVGWPVSAWLEANYDWRIACLTWAAVNALVCLPLYCSLPREGTVLARPAAGRPPRQGLLHGFKNIDARMLLLAFFFSATAFSSAAMAAHLPAVLQAAGISAAAAIVVGMLIGPAQVGARLLELTFMDRIKPIMTARLAVAMHPVGAVLLLAFGTPLAAVFGILHGVGNGLLTLVKGALPLEIFGSQGYGERQGVLMVPARLAQASAPWLFGMALAQWGAAALVLTAALGAAALVALLRLNRGA